MTVGISDSLMLAILSMDAHNRDNINPRVNVSGTGIGNAIASVARMSVAISGAVPLWSRMSLRSSGLLAHNSALVACARKLLIYANTVVQRGTPWTEKSAVL